MHATLHATSRQVNRYTHFLDFLQRRMRLESAFSLEIFNATKCGKCISIQFCCFRIAKDLRIYVLNSGLLKRLLAALKYNYVVVWQCGNTCAHKVFPFSLVINECTSLLSKDAQLWCSLLVACKSATCGGACANCFI